MNCKNCNTEINSKFCPDCGQPASLKRIDGHYIIHEIEHVLHFERGILYTIKELLTKPGQSIRKYLSENRSRLVKPIIFIIITSLIYSIINHVFHIEEGYIKQVGLEKSAIGDIVKWMQEYYGYANIIMGVFIAFWLKIFFKKYGYNFYEILIMLCFTIGISMLFYAVFSMFQGILHIQLFQVGAMSGAVYVVWASANFFEEKKPINYLKALISLLLGALVFEIVILIIGVSIDLINRH